jgi:hypothetical protein
MKNIARIYLAATLSATMYLASCGVTVNDTKKEERQYNKEVTLTISEEGNPSGDIHTYVGEIKIPSAIEADGKYQLTSDNETIQLFIESETPPKTIPVHQGIMVSPDSVGLHRSVTEGDTTVYIFKLQYTLSQAEKKAKETITAKVDVIDTDTKKVKAYDMVLVKVSGDDTSTSLVENAASVVTDPIKADAQEAELEEAEKTNFENFVGALVSGLSSLSEATGKSITSGLAYCNNLQELLIKAAEEHNVSEKIEGVKRELESFKTALVSRVPETAVKAMNSIPSELAKFRSSLTKAADKQLRYLNAIIDTKLLMLLNSGSARDIEGAEPEGNGAEEYDGVLVECEKEKEEKEKEKEEGA